MTVHAPSTALLTDHYELTMVEAALRSGAASRRCVFEVFARRLPEGRRYGVVAGTVRLVEAVERFRFTEAEIEFLRTTGVVDEPTLEFLAGYRFIGDIWGYAEGECYFPGSPVLVVESDFAEAVVLETLVLSILNHDSAVASAASRMTSAAGDRPCIEMGSRRTHEVWPDMYSPADLPSSTRAAPAKNRIWSTIGPISSLCVSATGLPVFCVSAATRSSALASTASAIRIRAFCRSLGVASRQVSKAADAAA